MADRKMSAESVSTIRVKGTLVAGVQEEAIVSSTLYRALDTPDEAIKALQANNVDAELNAFDPVSVVIIGAGQRGRVYASYTLERPHLAKVVAVAEPDPTRRAILATKYDVPAESQFDSWTEVAAQKQRVADVAVIATQDRDHIEPALAFSAQGYEILLEKPMSVTEEACVRIVTAAEEASVILAVGHVLSGVVGEVVNVQHVEQVGYTHQAHSFVRGNWSREVDSTFMLLAKCCHDVDLIRHWMGVPCTSVASFGSLNHFNKEKAPAGSTERCLDCPLQTTCPYSAVRIYKEPALRGHFGWPADVIVDVPDIEEVNTALKTGPYGRCVYRCDNDVVDNQVVAMQFEGGKTATLTMAAFTKDLCIRQTHIFGTHGEIICHDERYLEINNFSTGETSRVMPEKGASTSLAAHNYGDFYLADAFFKSVVAKKYGLKDEAGNPLCFVTSPREALESHRIVFAAEEARRNSAVVNL